MKTIGAVRNITRSFELSAMRLLLGVALTLLYPMLAQASPYASCLSNNAGNISFILNEGGGNVTVTYEDGTTNASYDGITTGTNLAVGAHSFALSGHNGFSISVTKTGNGIPSLISEDTNQFSVWASPRGVDVNKNAKFGSLFGRTYIGNSAAGLPLASEPSYYWKGKGLYALNADFTEALGQGTNAWATSTFNTGSANSPWRLRLAPDNTLIVNDLNAASAAIWQFAPDMSSSNLLLANIGVSTNHANEWGTPYVTGTLAQGNLTLWVGDPNLQCPTLAADPGLVVGPATTRGSSYNCVYRYDIGSGPLPWAGMPNYAYTMGLDGIANLRTESDIGQDGKIIAGFGRANLSNPDIQILSPDGLTPLWDSWADSGETGTFDPWNGLNTAAGQVGTYCGVRVSPDGRLFASVDTGNGITLANLTNGIPDDSTIYAVPQPDTDFPGGFPATAAHNAYVGNARGMCWDAANNLLVCSSGQGLLRAFSLGASETCVTTNDASLTNGAFYVIVPSASATVVASTPTASQNYGIPSPGVFTITLNQSTLSLPVQISFTMSGTAGYLTNYTLNLGTDGNGVTISSNSVTFPAGTYPGVGNWSVNVQIIPTATPVSGPTLTAIMTLRGGANNVLGTPHIGTVNIFNTGPQLLLLTNAVSGATMSRGIANDYAQFVITRWGDLSAPAYTITNFTYLGTAVFPGDYAARAQAVTSIPLTPGQPGITINPGVVVITNAVGNPVAHGNLNLAPTNVTIIISLTNSATGTNATASNGQAYSANTSSVTLTEFDNTIGPEVVLWSNPLTNSLDSTNWTLTFAATNLAGFPVPPVVIPNYTNDETAIAAGGTNDFRVEFGKAVSSDSVSPSPAMSANGWTTALRMTVNKDGSVPSQTGVNLYPQGQNFAGNYALRFSMYLSIYSSAIDNPAPGTYPREFALFGINHTGTNCNWRTAFSIGANPGYAAPTNADGVWFAMDAGWGSISPADFDAFTSPALPNSGVSLDYVSQNSQQNSGIFKSPPFASVNLGSPRGGEPINQWVDVSVEVTKQTNVTVYMDRAPVLPSFTLTNLTASGGGNYTSGKVMLGYLDPVPDQSDNSAFVYYSNLRVVELSPYIYAQPLGLIVLNGANVSFTASGSYATAPITNTWYFADTNLVPLVALQADTANATNLTSTLALNNVQVGTNILSVFNDVAGSVTSSVVSLEVITGPTNRTVNAGSNTVQFAVLASGFAAPTYQWMTNGVKLVNGTHFAGVTTATLTITNVQLADAATYTVAVTNASGGLAPSATLTVLASSPTITTMSLVGTNAVMAFTTSNPFDNAGSFTLQSATIVQGPYVNTAATLSGTNPTFQYTVPLGTNSTMFYRIKHN